MFANNNLFASITFVIQTDKEDEIIYNIKSFFKSPSEYSKKHMSFIDMIVYFSNNKFINKTEDLFNVNSQMNDQIYFHGKSHFVKRLLTSEEIDILIHELSKFSTGYVLFDIFGGKINDFKQNDSSFIHRKDIIYGFQSVHASYEIVDLTILNNFDQNLSFMFSDESFQNYIDESLQDALQKYYGSNLDRLKIIKQKYDPENFFCFPLSIPLPH